ncbi:uncharacterized protein LOC125674495 [Ostrea edulis]|uniref:uncharacterized protein LOC125674495 n=1 Tax=Ostrea edulis TaxID=37623 RepID=UPI0024AF0E69|nr:uncharacterized protein LOC125674495 [Ostrea edulis]
MYENMEDRWIMARGIRDPVVGASLSIPPLFRAGWNPPRTERLSPGDINALVFQGGGAKGIAYCGAIKELTERKIKEKVTRFGGASAGAICAAFLALGCSTERMEELLKQDFYEMLMGDRNVLIM